REETMTATRPPFRADHVGSLLRPPAVRDARIARAEGRIDTSALREIEDEAIRNAIARQCAIGLRAVTDGEYRRAFWHFDFLRELDGVELVDGGTGIQFKGAATRPKMLKVTGRIDFAGHPMLDHFAFVRDNAGGAVAKQTIPSPSVLHFRGGRQAVDPSVYPDMDGFFEDLGNAYRKAVGAF